MRAVRWGFGLWLAAAACGESRAIETSAEAKADGEVALVVLVKGKMTIRGADEVERQATEETRLRRSDMLLAGKDGMLVVVLANQYVVKVSEDTPVRKLAHLDEPPAKKSLSQMFEEQLGANYESMIGSDKLTRIAAWNQGQAAGETVAPITKQEAPPPRIDPTTEDDRPTSVTIPELDEKQAESDKKGAGGAAGAPAPTTPTTNTKLPDETKKKVESKDTNKGDAKKAEPLKPEPPPVVEPKPPVNDVPTDAASRPNKWIRRSGDASDSRSGLPKLLRERWGLLAGCLAGAAELRVKVEDNVVQSVTPASCSGTLVGESLPEAEGTATVVVKLR